MNKKIGLPAAIALLAAFAAVLLVQRAAQGGLGFSPDSVSYYTMAEGLASGQGFVDVRRYAAPVPPIYPPGYSLAIAGGGLAFGGDLMAALPWVNGLLFAAAVVLFLWGLGRAGASPPTFAAGGLLFLASGHLVELYARVWSETAFLTATLLFIVLLARYLDDPPRSDRRLLIGAALAAGAAVLVRYPGVAAIGGGGLALLLRHGEWKRRLQDAALFGAVAAAPLALWLLRNVAVFGRPYLGKDRAPSGFAFRIQNLELGLETLREWSGTPVGSYLLGLAVLFLGLGLRRRTESPRPDGASPAPLLAAAAAFALPYLAVMLAGTYAYGLHKPLNYRALAPIFGPLLWLLLLGGERLARRWMRGRAPRIGAGLVAASLGGLAYLATVNAWAASDPASVYGMLQKPERAVVEAFRDIEPTGTVFSNIDDHLYLLTGQSSLRLPQVYSLDSRDIRLPDYDQKMDALERQLGDGGMIVYYSPSRRHYLPSETELLERLPLEVVLDTEDGTIYRVRSRR